MAEEGKPKVPGMQKVGEARAEESTHLLSHTGALQILPVTGCGHYFWRNLVWNRINRSDTGFVGPISFPLIAGSYRLSGTHFYLIIVHITNISPAVFLVPLQSPLNLGVPILTYIVCGLHTSIFVIKKTTCTMV